MSMPDVRPYRPSLVAGDNEGGEGGDEATKKPSNKAATGASAAGVRAVTAQFVAFYFRAPMKAFFRTRVDYMGYARAINPQAQSASKWSWHTTTPGLLAHAVKTYGWSFIPNQILPPMLANVSVGAVLYTTYLQSLAAFHEPSGRASKRIYPPPDPSHTFMAGLVAGSVQSLVAAPLDALQVRFQASEMLEGQYKNMWHYAHNKLKQIGPQGIFAGWGLSLMKDSLGSAVFFSTFEYVKAQVYYDFLTRYYSTARFESIMRPLSSSEDSYTGDFDEGYRPVIRPHYMMEPIFILLAGVTASVAQQIIQFPLATIQDVHYRRLESLDYAAKLENRKASVLRLYYRAYQKTFEQSRVQAQKAGSWRTWLYRGFVWNTVRQTPSTSAGLIVFEVIRRKWADSTDVVRIQKDGYDVLLT